MRKTVRFLLFSAALALAGLSCERSRSTPAPAPEAQTPSDLSPVHPLEAASAAEFQEALRLLREQGHVNDSSVISLVAPHEPTKEELESFQAGTPVPRRVLVVVYDSAHNETYEGLVRVTSPGSVERWTRVPGVQPPLGKWDHELAQSLAKQDPRWRAALARRGVSDVEAIYHDTWAMGPSQDPQLKGHRLVKTLPFLQGTTPYSYARPVEGLLALIDLSDRKVVEVIDRGDMPIAKDVGAYEAQDVGPLRARPHPVVVTHPEGVNFTLTGNEVRWQNWRFRVEAQPREGPVLHGVSYTDAGRERKILHRLSLSEMVVPYGDPEDTWSWRSAFDVGEYGFGANANPLEAGSDVPTDATFLPSVYVEPSGQVRENPRALAIYERDGGLLWKHYNPELQRNESRRSIELVVAFGVTVENYDYLLYYVFKQDGSMEVEAELTGIMLAKGMMPMPGDHEEHELYGHVVSEGVLAVHHQHFFNFRIDFDVDGPRNSVLEMNSLPIPKGEANPVGNAFTMRMDPLTDESSAQRDLSLAQARRWLILNPEQRNALGQPTGYALVPGENAVPYASADNLSRLRAGFIDHPFWATRYAPQELYAAGVYPNQSEGGDGLPTWVRDNQSLVNEDVVVWYTLGVTHTPRPEEWPVMATAHAGFKLLPVGFFAKNPALDVPRGAASP
jgi:primary-amine oxidase